MKHRDITPTFDTSSLSRNTAAEFRLMADAIDEASAKRSREAGVVRSTSGVVGHTVAGSAHDRGIAILRAYHGGDFRSGSSDGVIYAGGCDTEARVSPSDRALLESLGWVWADTHFAWRFAGSGGARQTPRDSWRRAENKPSEVLANDRRDYSRDLCVVAARIVGNYRGIDDGLTDEEMADAVAFLRGRLAAWQETRDGAHFGAHYIYDHAINQVCRAALAMHDEYEGTR